MAAALAPIAGAVGGSVISGLMGSGGSSQSIKIAPTSQQEIDLINAINAANYGAPPTKRTLTPADIKQEEIDAEYAKRRGSGVANLLAGLQKNYTGQGYLLTPEQEAAFGIDRNTPKTGPGGSYSVEDITRLYANKYGNTGTGSLNKDEIRAELLKQKQSAYDTEYETANKAYQEQASALNKSLSPDQAIQDLFKQKVTSYLSRKEDGSVDPKAFEAAKSFVDQTFTNPAQEVLNQSQSRFEQGAAARQAALGRTGGMDSTFQKQLFGNLANQQADLGVQRGAMISDYYQNQPIRDIGVAAQGLEGISAIQSQNAFAPKFLNDLNQQAQINRLNLLNNLTNARTGNQTTTTAGPDIGIVGRAAQGAQLGQGLGDLLSKSFTTRAPEYSGSTGGGYMGGNSGFGVSAGSSGSKYGFGF